MRLSEIRGHEPIRKLIADAAARGSLPPCLVFAGPEGVGKYQLALALASVVNCEDDASRLDCCGKCGSCRGIARGAHPDVVTVAPGDTGKIKVDAIRDVLKQLAYRPFEGHRRVVVINEADRLVQDAQNALLKTLEEPPSTSMLLLITHRPNLLLDTVRSRCPQIRFGSLTTEEVENILVSQHELPSATARAAAAAADGSVARALEAGSGDYLEARESAVKVLRVLATKPSAKIRLELGTEFSSYQRGAKSAKAKTVEREGLRLRLRALGTLFRDVQVVSVKGDHGWLANADLESELVELAKFYDIYRAGRGFENVDRAVTALTGNASVKVVADWLTQQI